MAKTDYICHYTGWTVISQDKALSWMTAMYFQMIFVYNVQAVDSLFYLNVRGISIRPRRSGLVHEVLT